MNRTAVKSSNLKSIGYDEKTTTLEVEFSGGNVYQYRGVPKDVYTALLAEQERVSSGDQEASVGSLFVTTVRNNVNFVYEKSK